MTGLVDRLDRELDAARTARPRDSAGYAAALERALRACDADPAVADALDAKVSNPDSAKARAEYAAHLAAERDPALIAWPPGRNQPCWCGSGRKYKKCCAAMISADLEAHR